MLEKTYSAIREYLEDENGYSLIDIVNELDSYNGNLSEYRWYDMSEFNELNESSCPMDIAQRIFYGSFNPNDSHFRYDGYGNFESADSPEYDDMDINEFMEEIDNIPFQFLPDGIREIILENEMNMEDEEDNSNWL